MDELDLLRKKTGMTIGKAFTVVFTLFLSTFVVGIAVAIIFKDIMPKKIDIIEDNIFLLMLIVFLFGNIWAYYINKKEFPFFKKSSFSIIITSIIVAVAYSYISPGIIDIYPFGERAGEKIDSLEITNLLTLAISIIFTFLQIGFIGHGLLKNYHFKQAIFAVAAVSIMFFVPQAVIGLMFQSLIMFYVYYRTASFQLPIIMTIMFSLVEDSFKIFYGNEIIKGNYIRTHFVQDNTLYFAGLIASVFVILGGLYFIKRQTKVIEWQRPDEDENIAFL